jgi:hypothetical protein
MDFVLGMQGVRREFLFFFGGGTTYYLLRFVHLIVDVNDKTRFLPVHIHYLGRTSRRLEDNIKMDFQEVGCGGFD